MNTTQIMSVAPQVGTAKTAAASSNTKLAAVQKAGADDSRSKDDFDSTLEKSQGVASKETSATSAKDASDDVSGQAEAVAAAQPQTAKNADKAAKPAGKEKAEAGTSAGDVAEEAALAAVLAVAGARTPEETAAKLLSEPQSASATLQTLLPQDTAESAQQTKLLAMLAGQAFASDSQVENTVEAIPETLGASAVPADQKGQIAGITLPAAGIQQQDSLSDALASMTAWNKSQTANVTQTMTGAAQQQTAVVAEQVVQEAHALPAQAALQAGATTSKEQAGRSVQVSDFANLFGVEVQVDGAEPVQPITAQSDGSSSSLFSQDQQQSRQSFSQLFGQGTSQLPEEASLDKAPESADASTRTSAAQGLASFSQTLANTENVSVAAPQAIPQTDYEIPRQIVDQARLIQRGQDTQMVIHLKPEHLGDLTLRVSVGTDGAVSASFHSNNAEVRTIIENTLVQLKQELNNQGIKVDNVGVYAGLADGGLPQDQGQQQAFQQGSQQHRSTRESAAAFEDGQELAAALAAQEGSTATDGVDYRI